jgi:hypothetical protein
VTDLGIELEKDAKMKVGQTKFIKAAYAETPTAARVAVGKLADVIERANALMFFADAIEKSSDSVENKYQDLSARVKELKKLMEHNGCLGK